MAGLLFRQREIGIKKTGVSVTIPDNDRARVMYYLSCICGALELKDKGYDLERLTNYEQYYMLSTEEEKVLTIICATLSPDELEGKCIFLNENACGDSTNEFFDISSAQTTFAAARRVVIGESSLTVKKIMCYKRSWILRYYLEPMQSLIQKLNAGRRQPKPKKGCTIS